LGAPTLRSIGEVARTVGRSVAEIVFPPACAGCGALGEGICAICISQLDPLSHRCCRQCNRALEHGDQCAACRHQERRIDHVFVRYPYETPVRDAILRLKFNNKRYLAAALAGVAAQALPDPLDVDALIPIPLGARRERERGFNQSQLIAAQLTRWLPVPVLDQHVIRHRDTVPQTSLVREARWRNVIGAFTCLHNMSGARVLLVDDVAATGATLEAAARALRRRGAAWVGAVVAARPPPDRPLPP